MNPLQQILQWFVSSTWFKKYSAFFGGYALGMWTMTVYWREIVATLKVWNIQRSTFIDCLLFVAGASGIIASVLLSVAKAKQDQNPTDPCKPQ